MFKTNKMNVVISGGSKGLGKDLNIDQIKKFLVNLIKIK